MALPISPMFGSSNASLWSNASPFSAAEPVMHFFSSALLLGSYALGTVLGRPQTGSLLRRSVDGFIEKQTPIALERLQCNIGPDGCTAAGVHPGAVIASPDRFDPPYFFTWTRDSALVFKSIVDRFAHHYDAGLQRHIEQFVGAQAKLQAVSNPSGSLSNGAGLGEAKFEVDLTAYTGDWGRPQHDGPPLRAVALINYARWLIDNGYESTALEVVWPVARNDLEYVAQYWNNTGFDLWEEVMGSSFFTTASQHRALVEGAALAAELGLPDSKYADIAPHVLCFMQSFWVPSGAYIDANTNTQDGRTGKDANTILAAIHTFDVTLGCDAATFQPCSDKALANLKAVVDSFRWYNINHGIPQGIAVAVGRYAEDVYYNGNPWYLNTLAVAEQLYDALYTWDQQGSLTVTQISLAFFRDLVPGISTGTYNAGSSTYKTVINAVSAYADGFVDVVAKYVPEDGSMAEQYHKDSGAPLGASDLTWSYASFLTATSRRAGIVPRPWANETTISIPETCQRTTAAGSYTRATKTTFPQSQTPIGGVPAPTTTQEPCATPTAVDVTFEVQARTQLGQTIKIVGDAKELGAWDTGKAVALSPSQYTDTNPVWKGTIKLEPGQDVKYKYINVNQDGSLTWEVDPNRQYVVPRACRKSMTKKDEWRS